MSCTTQAVAYCGATKCSKVTIGTITCPTGISATITNNNTASPTITFKTTATITAACEATIPVSVDGVTINKKFSFAVAKTGATGATGSTGATGPQGPKGDKGDTGAAGKDANQIVHSASGDGNVNMYMALATFKITGNYINTPIQFKITSRGRESSNVYVMFNSTNGTDPSLTYIRADGEVPIWIQKTATSTWRLICQKNEPYGSFAIGNYINRVGVSVTWTSEHLASVPSSTTANPVINATRLISEQNAAKTATNYMKFENNVGLIVGDMTKSTLGNNVLIDSDSVDIRSGSTVLASYGKDYVYIGKNSETAKIDLCSGAAKMYNEEMYEATAHRFVIEPQEWLYMSGSKIDLNTYYDDASTYGEVDVSLDTWSVSGMNYHRTPGGNFQLVVKTGSSTNSSIYNYAGIGVSDTDLNSNTGSSPLRLYKGCSHENYSGETSIDLYNDSLHINGNTWAHGLISCEGILYAQNNIEAYQDIGVKGDMWFTSEKGRFYVNKNGVQREAMNLASGDNGDMSIGWTNYNSNLGALYIGGADIYTRVANTASKTEYRPYYRKGDSITIRAALGGYSTNSGKSIYFVVPLTKPVIGNPTVSVASVNGLILRQNNSYPHSSSSWCKPASYTAQNVATGIGVGVHALFNDNSGVTNNSPIGVDASLKITFS